VDDFALTRFNLRSKCGGGILPVENQPAG